MAFLKACALGAAVAVVAYHVIVILAWEAAKAAVPVLLRAIAHRSVYR